MKKLFLLVSLLSIFSVNAYNIGLLIVATGQYIVFVQPLIESANKHFCTNHAVTYFVFTDGQCPQAPNIVPIEQKKLGWPLDTMMRIAMYHQHRDKLVAMDYLFAMDADMLFVDTVGEEILSNRVATLHPGFVGQRATYERRRQCTAYVGPKEGTHYFAGGFHGGCTAEFLRMVAVLTENIYKDLARDIIAIWHDESHINRYFIDNPPTKILSPSYCYSMNLAATNGRVLPYQKRIIALDKNHNQMRK